MADILPILNLEKSAKILKFVGLCPFYSDVSTKGRTFYYILYSGLIYSLLLNVMFIHFTAVLQSMPNWTADFSTALKLLERSLGILWLTITPLLYWDWSRKLSNYLSMWTTLELLVPVPYTFEKSDEHFSFKNIKRSGLLFTVIMITYFLKSLQIRYLLVYGLMTAFYLTLCLWLQNCIIIDTFIRRLNRFIKVQNLQHQDFNTLLHYWMEFCEIIEASNALFSHLLCFLLCAQAGLLTLNSYSVLSRLLLTTAGEYCQGTTVSAILMCFFSWSIYTVCDISHHISKQIKSNIQLIILFSNIRYLDFSRLTKLRKTLQIINMISPSIYILNCLKIDRKLLVSLVSIITTYLVVLIQFRMSSHEYQPGSSILDSIFRNRTSQ